MAAAVPVQRGAAVGSSRIARSGAQARPAAAVRVSQRSVVTKAQQKREMMMWEALREGLDEEMERDPTVCLMGEDVGHYGGSYKVSNGLYKKYGDMRLLDTPICENGFLGMGVGAAMTGLRPIVEGMNMGFLLLAFNQISNNCGMLHYTSGGQFKVPMVIRGPGGVGRQLGAEHSQRLESYFQSIPGVQLVAVSTVANAKALLKSAIRSDNPIIFFEHVLLYNVKGEVHPGDYCQCLERAEMVREGTDVTIFCYSRMRYVVMQANASDVCAWTGITCLDGAISTFAWQCSDGEAAYCGVRAQGTISPALANLTSLRELWMGGQQFTGTLPAVFGGPQVFENLVYFMVGSNQLSGTIPASFGSAGAFPKLETMWLSNNRLQGSLPFGGTYDGSVASFTKLSLFTVEGNNLTGSLPPNLPSVMPSLKELYAGKSGLEGSLPDAWAAPGSFPNLTQLVLSNNRLNGTLPAAWATPDALQALSDVFLEGNRLSGSLPEAWGSTPGAFLKFNSL